MGDICVQVRAYDGFRDLTDDLVNFLKKNKTSIKGHELKIVIGNLATSLATSGVVKIKILGNMVFTFSYYSGKNEGEDSLKAIAEEYINYVNSLLRKHKKLFSLLPVHPLEYLNTVKDVAKREFMSAYTVFSGACSNLNQLSAAEKGRPRAQGEWRLRAAKKNRYRAETEWRLGAFFGVGALLTGIFLSTAGCALLGLVAVAVICLAIHHETKANHLSPRDEINLSSPAVI